MLMIQTTSTKFYKFVLIRDRDTIPSSSRTYLVAIPSLMWGRYMTLENAYEWRSKAF